MRATAFAGRTGVAAALALLATCALAQTPPPLDAPSLDLWAAGTVETILRRADGSVIVGGAFTSVYDPALGISIARSNLAKFAPNGALDLAWNPAPDAPVYALAEGANGQVYVGGTFLTIGGLSRSQLARIDAGGSGAPDAMWNPNPQGGTVTALAVDGNAVYAGGFFTSIGGEARANLAKLSATGTGSVDTQWNPAPAFPGEFVSISSIAVDGAGDVFVGGYFSSIGGQPRGNLAKLSPVTGAADPAWNPSADSAVEAIVLDGGGALYAGGLFFNIGGQAHRYVARLSSTGTGAADAAFDPTPDRSVLSLAIGGGAIYVGGVFRSIEGTPRRGVARVSVAGAVDAWDAQGNGNVLALAYDPSGVVLAGGELTRTGAVPRLAFARLDPSTAASLATPYVQRDGGVRAIARDAAGNVFVGGQFARAGDAARTNLLKLTPDLALDPSWAPEAEAAVHALAVGPGGVYAGGEFGRIGGVQRNFIAKLDPAGTGAVDALWNPNAGGTVYALALDGSGALFAGGVFQNFGGTPHALVAKMSATGTGSVDALWNPGFDNALFRDVRTLAIDAGLLYAGGVFSSIGGAPYSSLARVTTTGTGAPDATWKPDAAGSVEAIAVGNDGVYVGGNFNVVGGQPRYLLGKVTLASGAAVAGWMPEPNDIVRTLALDGNGHLFVGGQFNAIAGQSRARVAKLLTGTGAADPGWHPQAGAAVSALTLAGNALIVGGEFTLFGGSGRRLLAAVPAATDAVFADGFE